MGAGDVELVRNATCEDGVLGPVGADNYPAFETWRAFWEGSRPAGTRPSTGRS